VPEATRTALLVFRNRFMLSAPPLVVAPDP
jgi:hypothetical protein